MADLESVRRERELEAWVVFAHSTAGGSIALRYARRHPDRLRGLVLCSCAADASFGGGLGERLGGIASAEQLAALSAAFATPRQSDDEYRSRVLALLPLYFARDAGRARRRIAETVSFAAAPFDYFKARVLPAYDERPHLERLTIPTLVVAGRADRITPPEIASRPLLAIPGSRWVELDAGHFPFLERPAAFRRAVLGWLAELEPAR